MRILLTIHHDLDVNSGAAGVILRLRDEFRGLGHTADVLSFDDMPAQIPRSMRPMAFPAFVAGRLAKLARHYDVIDASSGDAWIYYSAFRGRPRPLFVTHSHGLEHLAAEVERSEALRGGRSLSLKKRLWRHGYRLFEVARSFKAADLSLVLNSREAECLAHDFGIGPDRIRRARLAVGVKGLPKVSRAGIQVVQIGSYIPRKGVQHTARAMTGIMMKRSDVSMRFIGTNVDRERVLADYPSDLYGRIDVVKRYSNAELPALLADADIQLMPSLFEGYGIAKIEAMACGVVPVVSSDAGTATDVDHEVDGLVVQVADAEALAEAVERLIDDAPLRTTLQAHAIQKAAEASWPKVAAERIASYRQMLDSTGSG